MNQRKYILSFFVTIIYFTTLSGQTFSTEGVVVKNQVTEKEKVEIIKVLKNRWQVFISSGDLSNEKDRDDYLSIFDFDAIHYLDYKQKPGIESIEIVEYVDKSKQELPSGLVFLIENPKLTSIGVAEDFNFFAEITFTKIFNEFIDLTGKLKFVDSGLVSEQTIRFSIDSYEIEKAYIQSIEGVNIKLDKVVAVEESVVNKSTDEESINNESVSKKSPDKDSSFLGKIRSNRTDDPEIITFNEVESTFSASLRSSLGGSLLERSDNAELPRAILGDTPSSKMNYLGFAGLNLNYRRSIGSEQKLYFNFDFGLELGRVNVDISNFKHGQESTGYTNNAFISNSARSNRIDGSTSFEVQTFVEQDEATIFLLGDAFIQGGGESTSIFLFNFSPGISYEIFESGSSLTSIFFDLGVDVNFLLRNGTNNISYEGSIKNGFKIPDGVFPTEDAIIALSSDSELQELRTILELNYRTGESDDINDLSGTTSSNNLFYGVKTGISLQHKINYGFGFEIGAQYHLGLTPLYSISDQESGFLEGSLSETRNASIIEQYYPDTKLNRLTLRVGLFFLLNQN